MESKKYLSFNTLEKVVFRPQKTDHGVTGSSKVMNHPGDFDLFPGGDTVQI
jgi:hypothetical protein